jgi:hypothetical protein
MQTVNLPKVQTQDRNMNQLQNNTSTALQTVGNLINQVTIIGMIIQATINLDQLQRQAGPGWVPCDGKSIVGSALNKLSGQLTAPTIANSYVRIN